MTRFRNAVTGVIVNVDDATAAQLGASWIDADVAWGLETAPDETDTEAVTEQGLETAPAKSRARNIK